MKVTYDEDVVSAQWARRSQQDLITALLYCFSWAALPSAAATAAAASPTFSSAKNVVAVDIVRLLQPLPAEALQ